MTQGLRFCLHSMASLFGISFLLVSMALSAVALPVLLCALFWLE